MTKVEVITIMKYLKFGIGKARARGIWLTLRVSEEAVTMPENHRHPGGVSGKGTIRLIMV